MKIKKPPRGYATWVQLYDAIMKQEPHLLKSGKSVINVCYTNEDGSTGGIKVSAGTIERNCWKELQEDRLDFNEGLSLKLDIYEKARLRANPIYYSKVSNLLSYLTNTAGHTPSNYFEKWARQSSF